MSQLVLRSMTVDKCTARIGRMQRALVVVTCHTNIIGSCKPSAVKATMQIGHVHPSSPCAESAAADAIFT
jgi:hypothetical protein